MPTRAAEERGPLPPVSDCAADAALSETVGSEPLQATDPNTLNSKTHRRGAEHLNFYRNTRSAIGGRGLREILTVTPRRRF